MNNSLTSMEAQPTWADPHALRNLYHQMVLIRRFDEIAVELRVAGRIFGSVHPYVGQEAIAVGACSALQPLDRITSTHRGHGHCLAKGADVNLMMAELFGRRAGLCKGKGGSMHIADFELGILGANGIVAAGLPIAAGSALAASLRGEDTVTVAFFGDGATGEGEFHESLNVSALWRLPVVWVCENNGWAADTPASDGLNAEITDLAGGYGMPAQAVNGNDVVAVHDAVADAVNNARAGGGPSLVEARTFRMRPHYQRDVIVPDHRPASVLAEWQSRDPIDSFAERLQQWGVFGDDDAAAVAAEVESQISHAVDFAEASDYPEPSEALEDLFATPVGRQTL